MPDPRGLLVAIGVGAAIGVFTLLWWHWPLALSIGGGILLGGLTLTGTISIGQDAAAADAAWRDAAPDLADTPAHPLNDAVVDRAETPRGRDIPSGDLRPKARLRAEGLEPSSWSNGAFDRYAAHEHGYDKVLVCASGSIRFGVPDAGRFVVLAPGDRLDLPAGTRHDAVVGARRRRLPRSAPPRWGAREARRTAPRHVVTAA